MSLSSTEKQALKGKVHDLRVGVIVGRAGLTEGVLKNIRAALGNSELVKVRMKLPAEDVAAITDRIITEVPCELVVRTGFNSVFYLREQASDD